MVSKRSKEPRFHKNAGAWMAIVDCSTECMQLNNDKIAR